MSMNPYTYTRICTRKHGWLDGWMLVIELATWALIQHHESSGRLKGSAATLAITSVADNVVDVDVYAYVCVCVCVCVCRYICTYLDIYTHVGEHVYVYVYA